MKNELCGLLEGAYDLHVHSAPDVLTRKVNDYDMAERVTARKMAGFVSKNHFSCTAQRAELVNEKYPACHAVGSICLNNAVGGINPIAVELAARAGARLVWFPTCDAQWERDFAEKDHEKKAFWASIVDDLQASGVASNGISVLDEQGKVKTCVYDVLEIIRKNQLVLCTGHISHAETFALVKAAKEQGVERIIVTHVTFPSTFYTVEEQRELIRCGAYMEQCYSTYATGKVALSTMLSQMKEIGAAHCVLGTDLGQITRVEPDVGLLQFVTDLQAGGFTENEIRQMACVNSKALIDL